MVIWLLSGCSTISQDEAFIQVNAKIDREDYRLIWEKNSEDGKKIENSVQNMLKSPLDSINAVKIALINNRSLQSTYGELGLAQGELVQAGLLSNPILGYAIGRDGAVTTRTLSVELPFLDMLLMPLRRSLSEIRFEEVKLRVGDEVLKMARDTKKSYIEACVTRDIRQLRDQMLDSLEAAAQLSARQYGAGNLSKRNYLRFQNAYSYARVEAFQARVDEVRSRERLNRLLGVFGVDTRYVLAKTTLALLVKKPEYNHLESLAIEKRLDIQAMKKEVEFAARAAGIVSDTRYINGLVLGLESEKVSGQSHKNTIGAAISVPLFDMGQGRITQAKARYDQQLHKLYALSVDVRSGVREQYAQTQMAYTIADEHNRHIWPQSTQILEQTQLYYNGMLDGIYELLEDQRSEVKARMEAIRSIGEYHSMLSDLEYALGGKLPSEEK